jgi:hypothetical protein
MRLCIPFSTLVRFPFSDTVGLTAIRFPIVVILTYEKGYKAKSHLRGEREAVSAR